MKIQLTAVLQLSFYPAKSDERRSNNPVLMVLKWDDLMQSLRRRAHDEEGAKYAIRDLITTALDYSEYALDELIGCLVLQDKSVALQWSFDGKKMIILYGDGTLVEWDIHSKTHITSHLPFANKIAES